MCNFQKWYHIFKQNLYIVLPLLISFVKIIGNMNKTIFDMVNYYNIETSYFKVLSNFRKGSWLNNVNTSGSIIH